jgi:putative salt-induced outer membrane protein YdiY
MKKLFSLIIYLLFCVSFLNAQHLKKDGTPDRRYKENKSNYSSPSSTSGFTSPSGNNSSSTLTSHLKKDGNPDKRYKNNKTTTSYSKYHKATFSSTKKSISHPQYHKTNTSVPKFNAQAKYSYTVNRDANGKIRRSAAAKVAFMKQTNFPHGRPGYVIDHIIALKKGGCDCPGNMQWQTIAEAKAKDKWE